VGFIPVKETFFIIDNVAVSRLFVKVPVRRATVKKKVCYDLVGGIDMPVNRLVIYGILFFNSFSVFTQDSNIPEFFNLKWSSGVNEITEVCIGDTIIIEFETLNVPNGMDVNVEIWGINNNDTMDIIRKLSGKVNNGNVSIDWTAEFDLENRDSNYFKEIEKNEYVIIDYFFVIGYENIIKRSELLAIMTSVNRRLINDTTGEPLKHRPYGLFFPDGTWLFGTTDDEGRIIRRDIRRIGYYNIIS
jgi:hypothetical protein